MDQNTKVICKIPLDGLVGPKRTGVEKYVLDFEVFFNISDKEILFYLVDNCEGGNGISKRVFDSLIKGFQIYLIFSKTLVEFSEQIKKL